MKIAVVGKGGSGKSTVSWLLATQAANEGSRVLAVDADYNMDLAYSLGWTPERPTRYLNHAEADLLPLLKLGDDEPWNAMLKRAHRPDFRIDPADGFTERYRQPIARNLDLMVWGPPHEDLMYGSRCSHAYIAPLKFYLPFLQTGPGSVAVVDSVAGTDMVSYGLYLGVDAIVCVVEGTRQSIGVFRGIQTIAEEFGIPLYAIFNKASGHPLHAELKAELAGRVVGEIGIDPAIVSLQADALAPATTEAASRALRTLRTVPFDPEAPVARMRRWKDRLDNATSLH